MFWERESHFPFAQSLAFCGANPPTSNTHGVEAGGSGTSRPRNLFGAWLWNLSNPMKTSSPAVNMNLGVFAFLPSPPPHPRGPIQLITLWMPFRWYPRTCVQPPRLFKDPTTGPSPWPLVSTYLPSHTVPLPGPPRPSHTPYLPTPTAFCSPDPPPPFQYRGGDLSVGHSTECVVYEALGTEKSWWNPKIFHLREPSQMCFGIGVADEGYIWQLYGSWLLTHRWIWERLSGLYLLPRTKPAAFT